MCPQENRLLRHVPAQPIPLQRHVSARQRNAGLRPASRPQAAKLRPRRGNPKRRRRSDVRARSCRRAVPLDGGAMRQKEALEFRPLRGRCRSETGAPLPSAHRADCIFAPTGVPRTSRSHPLERLRTHNRLQRHVPPAGPATATCDPPTDTAPATCASAEPATATCDPSADTAPATCTPAEPAIATCTRSTDPATATCAPRRIGYCDM